MAAGQIKQVRLLSLARYLQAALARAEYERDEDGVVIGQVPNASGFFAQGETFEEAREHLRDVIEGNVLLALQLGLPIPEIEGVPTEVRDVEALAPQG
ncbi:MAG: type II toxin-antitoxin system HicB family antitoxin [Chloroflexota bacterium]